ncbi:hypothetical protein Cgig2_009353 [Carnegiea gigantea]|uniref:Uncharacterized protein n=1 Tax=Carnegiea gigantea TaxID=171969 RepID=A0A9Q1GQF5_9CARY|nr:hypothetical protein Cgig2_009353 [Carnegiea gigantea]
MEYRGKKKSHFKFCDMWIEDEKWRGQACTAGIFLKSITNPLKRLNNDRFSGTHNICDIAKQELNVIQKQLMLDPINIQLQEQEQVPKQGYQDALSASLNLKKQQSKLDWTTMSDQSTSFFFARVKQRISQLQICRLQDERGIVWEGRKYHFMKNC